MNRKDIRQEIQDVLEEHFVNDSEKEWVSVDKININRIDINIVSSINQNVSDLNKFIENTIGSYNNDLEKEEKIYLGFCNINSLEEAELLEIKKPIKKSKGASSFGAIIDNNENSTIKNKKSTKAKIISFYSYKGGVGRTVALIQTANLLAAKGKKVALIDLDIEAPSFNEIFSDDIEFDKGLINYLYNKLYDLEKVEVSSIVSKLSLNTKGEVYVIPTGNVNRKYVKMLEKLKEKRISENKYIEDLIDELYSKYDVEYVLIDSRTGINNWGALSIGEIADEVIILAYPNGENVRGTNLILDMIGDRKKCTVVFSRFDGSDAGKDKARDLFNEINIEQEFIGIEYDATIAINSKYPIEDKLSKFSNISDYILEDEKNRANNEWIKNNKEKAIKFLENLANGKKFENILTNDEIKFKERNNYIVVKNNKVDLETIVKGSTVNSILANLNFYDVKLNYNKNEISTIEAIISYLLSMVFVNCSSYTISEEKFEIQKEFEEYFEISIKAFTKEKEGSLARVLTNFMSSMDNISDSIDIERIYLILNVDDMFEQIPININNDTKLDVILIIMDWLNRSNKIQVKLVFAEENYKKYLEKLKEKKANLLNLSWNFISKDIIVDNIKQILDETSRYAQDSMKDGVKTALQVRLDNNEFEMKDTLNLQDYAKFIKSNKLDTNLIYCKRIDSTKYSKELVYWFSEKIQEKNMLSKKDVLDTIKEAAQIEKDNNKDKNSIITFDSINKAIEKM
ncbi:MAG: MinD-like ATPase involved in chromosome partitioning or flagellar assembly [Clostridium sp.]|jgi:MinD-like ATPase involved in chromosome partitioning or flagellar assembly